MPHKKGKRKTIPKHKKKGVKIIAKHKISADYPNKTNGNSGVYGKQKIIPRLAIHGKGGQNKKQQQTLQKRRLPVEVMPGNDSGSDWNSDTTESHGTVRVIDNISGVTLLRESINRTSLPGTGRRRYTSNWDSAVPKKREQYVAGANSSDKRDIKVINLTQAKKIREQVWIHHNGKKFETKCYVSWCTNMVDVFNFQVGHDTPKALGGSNTLINLKPICQNCNQSMGSRYSIAEWNQLFAIQQRRSMSTTSMLKVSRADETISNGNISDKVTNINTNFNKIDLYITEIDTQQQQDTKTEVNISSPLYTIQKMNYGPLASLVSYTAKSASLSPIKNVHPRQNLIIQSGITVIGAVIIAGSWLFGY
jgi:hypothetical protein